MAFQRKETNTRGIPVAVFVANVEEWLKTEGRGVDDAVRELNMLYSKYKLMEQSLVQQKRTTLRRIPDIESALNAVAQLVKQGDKNFSTHFQLSESVYASATVKPVDVVYLWIGANVMLQYTHDEALDLLDKNLRHAREKLKSLTDDIDFLKDQITTSEVNYARLHNHGIVVKRRQEAAAANATTKGKAAKE